MRCFNFETRFSEMKEKLPKHSLEVPQPRTTTSSAVAGSTTSPYLRSPNKNSPLPQYPQTEERLMPLNHKNSLSDAPNRDSNASAFSMGSRTSRSSIHSVSRKDIDKEAVTLTNELQYAAYKQPIPTDIPKMEIIEKRKKGQFNEMPLLPNQSSQNTIFVKSPRSRASLVRKDTTWDKGFWTHFCRTITCCIPTFLIKRYGMKDPQVIQAWREKVSLCLLFMTLMGMLAFITFLISDAICGQNYNLQVLDSDTTRAFIDPKNFAALGEIYVYSFAYTNLKNSLSLSTASGNDISASMIADRDGTKYCAAANIDINKLCIGACYLQSDLKTALTGQVRYSWNAIQTSTHLFVYNGYVVDLKLGDSALDTYFKNYKIYLKNAVGKDVTSLYRDNPELINTIRCFAESFRVGFIDTSSVGCFIRDIISNIAMIAILTLIIIRFTLAIGFSWFLSWKLGKWELQRKKFYDTKGNRVGSQPNIDSIKKSLQDGVPVNRIEIPPEFRLVHSILMVTCYSEDEAGLKTTLDSLCDISYPNRYKLIIVVCDGIVKGAGQEKSTPEIVLGLIKEDLTFGTPQPKSYFSIADGKKRHNMAKIHCGQFISTANRSTNIVVIIKCGTPEEASSAKPGNRGKRDSQIVLMDFYRAVMFDAPMSPLQFELFNKIYKLARVTADKYEIVLMVDADTKVMPDALSHMSAVVAKDPMIMGLCGETRIMNKSESWVSAIQVFEYHVAHHLAKAFESCFGGVTCLPGCFCMYRIKAPREDGSWTPVLASPEIVSQYSENVVNTLHKKNLLLLGEDRFLSTLMLRTFPNRKMMFVPKAVCKTCVPNSFSVLLSQRRRWINSTIHNLFELLLVQELCGTFCFSMQFVVLLELIGTLTLPAAILFTT